MNDVASRKCMPPAAMGFCFGQRGFLITTKTKPKTTMKPKLTHFAYDVEWREGFIMCGDCQFNCLANTMGVCDVCSHNDFNYHPIYYVGAPPYSPGSFSLADFEKALHEICVGWIGEEIGREEYIKSNANALLEVAKVVLEC